LLFHGHRETRKRTRKWHTVTIWGELEIGHSGHEGVGRGIKGGLGRPEGGNQRKE